MKYINKFDAHSAYTEVKSSLSKPNVSYCLLENEVHYEGEYTILTVGVYNQDAGFKYNIDFGGLTYGNRLAHGWDKLVEIKIDGVTVNQGEEDWEIVTFLSGEHTIEYIFEYTTDCPEIKGCRETINYIGGYSYYKCLPVNYLIIPDGIKRIEYFISLGGVHVPNTLEYAGNNVMCNEAPATADDVAILDACCVGGVGGWGTYCGK